MKTWTARAFLGLGSAGLVLAGCATGVVSPQPNTDTVFSECAEWDDWERPVRPFAVFGPVHYVGTCGIAVLLVETNAGHVLFDTGPAASADTVLSNLRAIGVEPPDVAAILSSHEHHDHVGGMARIQAATGADVIASREAAEVLRTGKAGPRDPQFGMHDAMTPVTVARVVRDGDTVEIGGVDFTATATPGHTPGALSWAWRACEGDVCRNVVYADSLSPVSADAYRFSDHPEAVARYRQGLRRLSDVACDLLLTPHPSASGMIARASERFPADPQACARYAASVGARLDRRLAEER